MKTDHMTGKRGDLNIPGKRKVVSRPLSLRKEQMDMLRNVAKFSGKSISSVVTELLEEERKRMSDDIQRES